MLPRLYLVAQRVSLKDSIGDSRPILLRSFDDPLVALEYQPHLASRSPPLIDLSRAGDPDLSFRAQISEMGQQQLVYIPSSAFHDVVWMNNEADHPMVLHNQGNLALPEIGRILVKKNHGMISFIVHPDYVMER